MELVIEKAGIKRRIKGSFALAISASDAHSLRAQLLQATEEGRSYGWITIRDDEVIQIPNTTPKEWDE